MKTLARITEYDDGLILDLGPLHLVCRPSGNDYVLVGKLIDAIQGRSCAALPVKAWRYNDSLPKPRAAMILGLELLVANLRTLAAKLDSERRFLSEEEEDSK